MSLQKRACDTKASILTQPAHKQPFTESHYCRNDIALISKIHLIDVNNNMPILTAYHAQKQHLSKADYSLLQAICFTHWQKRKRGTSFWKICNASSLQLRSNLLGNLVRYLLFQKALQQESK